MSERLLSSVLFVFSFCFVLFSVAFLCCCIGESSPLWFSCFWFLGWSVKRGWLVSPSRFFETVVDSHLLWDALHICKKWI